MESEERIPGITFHLEEASIGPSDSHKASGTIKLGADIDDPDLWEHAVEALNEFRVYASEDFKTDLIELLQEDKKRSDKELEQHRTETHSAVEQLKQRIDNLERENARLAFDVKKKDAELKYLRELRQQLDELA